MKMQNCEKIKVQGSKFGKLFLIVILKSTPLSSARSENCFCEKSLC